MLPVTLAVFVSNILHFSLDRLLFGFKSDLSRWSISTTVLQLILFQSATHLQPVHPLLQLYLLDHIPTDSLDPTSTNAHI